MLYYRPRLGSLALDLNSSTFRKAAIGLATVAMMGASAVASSPAAAQQQASAPFTAEQCRDAKIIGNAVMSKFRVSAELADSFVKFGQSNCDMNTNWRLSTPVDEKAFSEFRLKLIAIRTADASKPKAFAAQ